MTEELSWPSRVIGTFLDVFGRPAPAPMSRRLDRLPFGLHLTTGLDAIELFRPGDLDVFCFFQRTHSSLRHDVEYVTCLPEGDAPDRWLAYGVFRLSPEEELPFTDLNALERKLRLDYGSFVHLPRARPLLEHQYGDDLNDEDPPAGRNRVVAPRGEAKGPGRMTVAEVLDLLRKELEGPEIISWIEATFRQRPRSGVVEHRYYLDPHANLFCVRDHFAEGKTLFQAETSAEALRPIRLRH